MQLSELLRDIPDARVTGDPRTAIRGLAYDSRAVEPGFLFAALSGLKRDGLEYVPQAVARGAVAVLSSRPPAPGAGAAWVQVSDDRLGLALMARNYYGRPDERLTMVGVTGTNGKTTVSWLLEAALQEAGLRPCLFGTVGYRFGRDEQKADRTTPESLDLQRALDRFATAGARSCVMEVSSHALALRRVAGIDFRAGVFTNLTQDHLDFHGTMEAYLDAKAILFRGLAPDAVAVLNADDPASAALRKATRARVVTWGESAGADVRIASVRAGLDGTTVSLSVAPRVAAAASGGGAARGSGGGAAGGAGRGATLAIASPLLGATNARNLATAAAAALALGLPESAVTRGLAKVTGVPGRFERIDEGQAFLVLVDYAHTDDALASLLRTVRGLSPRRVITLFGCGGDRDRDKRPKMGFAAAAGSDVVVVTSDNPRTENPLAIIDAILPGVRRALTGDERGTPPEGRCHVVSDRREAIRRAISLAGPGDCVVLAGKGHETYQILGERTIPFDDRQAAREVLRAPEPDRGRAAGCC